MKTLDILKIDLNDNIFSFDIDLQLFNDESSQEKTELPTERKLKKARERGQIVKSKDIVDNVTILASLILIKIMLPFAKSTFHNYFEVLFLKYVSNGINSKTINAVFQFSILTFLKIAIPFLIAILIVSVVSNIAQVGFLYSNESIKFDLKKLNPISGIKRIFSKKSLLEVFKLIIKFLIIVLFLVLDFSNKIISSNNLILFDINYSISLMFNELFSYMIKISFMLFVLSFVDYYFQKKFYIKDMKMTKQELKDEYKQLEGDPFIKGKIKEKQYEITANKLLSSTKDATVIVTNPTHLSVAIKWSKGMPSPIITIMGSDSVAMKIREIAKDNNIPIVENKPLARALYNECEIGAYIPNKYWALVAQVLNYVMNLSN